MSCSRRNYITLVAFLCLKFTYGHKASLSDWLKQTNISALACQGEYTNVLCQNYEGIRILDAFWGRDDHLICQSSDPLDKLTHKQMCYATDKDDAYNKVKEMCDEVQTCRVEASPLLFEDLCPRVRKYVRVLYECRQMSGMKRFNIEEAKEHIRRYH